MRYGGLKEWFAELPTAVHKDDRHDHTRRSDIIACSWEFGALRSTTRKVMVFLNPEELNKAIKWSSSGVHLGVVDSITQLGRLLHVLYLYKYEDDDDKYLLVWTPVTAWRKLSFSILNYCVIFCAFRLFYNEVAKFSRQCWHFCCVALDSMKASSNSLFRACSTMWKYLKAQINCSMFVASRNRAKNFLSKKIEINWRICQNGLTWSMHRCVRSSLIFRGLKSGSKRR